MSVRPSAILVSMCAPKPRPHLCVISATIRPVRVRPQLQGAEYPVSEQLQSRVQVRRPRIRAVWTGDILAASLARREEPAHDQTVALHSDRNSPSCPQTNSTRLYRASVFVVP